MEGRNRGIRSLMFFVAASGVPSKTNAPDPMTTRALRQRLENPRIELALLLVASLACVVVLTSGIATSEGGGRSGIGAGPLLVAAVVAGAALLAIFSLISTVRVLRRKSHAAETQARDLQRNLVTAEALVKAEPQILIYWEQGKALKIVTQTLSGVPGLPSSQPELLRFGLWLDQRSSQGLKSALDTLFQHGRPFNMILKTAAGGHLEADGRAAGGRAVLRLRDVAGYKRDLSTILDQHANLARDIRAGRALLDALPSPSWLRSQDGRLAWVNEAYVKAVEAKSATEVLQKQIELMESRQRKAADKVLKKSSGYRDRLPLVVGGERKPHDIVILATGEATAGAAVDVAAIESAKGELDRQVASYDRTLDRVATAVAIYSAEQRLVFFNEAFQKLWQIDSNWLETRPSEGDVLDRLRDLGRLPEVVHYREWKTRILAGYRASSALEDWWHLPDGRVLHVMTEQRPDGGVTCLYDDETERLALESRFNALIGVQRETLNSLKEGVAVFGTDGQLKLFNTAFASIWKLSRRQLMEGPHIDGFIRDAGVLFEDKSVWTALSRAVTALSDERNPLAGQMVRPDSSVIDYAATPLPDGGMLLTFADVTDSKRYERILLERNEALEAADRLKDQFIGHVSYELRSPLQNIIGYSDLLAEPHVGPLNERQREYLEAVSSSSKTLLSLIDEILDLATIDAGALSLKAGQVNVRAVIDEAIAGIRERAASAELTLDIAIADDAGEFEGDEARVRQILYNLLSNAAGFSPHGGTIHVTSWREAGYMVFAIEDHGPGIPKEQLPRVFDRFESRSRGSSHRGAGLGLSIVKSLVELHSGHMTLDSEVGRGTRVTVRLPERGLTRSDEDPAVAHDPILERSAG